MNSKIETSIFLSIILMVFLVGCYWELNKKIFADNDYISWYKQTYGKPPTTIPTKNEFTPLIESMHTMALITFGADTFFSCLFLYYIFVERKKGM
jgi:hypothetical protein